MGSIGSVMRHCRNYFEIGYADDTFEISGGVLSHRALHGGYYAIAGSKFNDGVHAPDDALTDETFTGRVWLLNPPSRFVDLCRRIDEYEEKNPVGALQSESFGGYSYSRASDPSGGAATWQTAFKRELGDYQKLFSEVMC